MNDSKENDLKLEEIEVEVVNLDVCQKSLGLRENLSPLLGRRNSHAELDFWNDNLRSLNGARMRVEGTVRDLDARDLVSDAGDMLVGVTEFKGGVEDVSKRMQEPLCEDDLGESSNVS